MKISFQWILAAIIVLLIILVGAYELTNGSNTPATNVTATPTTTITLTPTPVAPSTTPTTVASVTPTATVLATPTPTPILSGASGVKKTDFGYYITYPPFSDNQVNVNGNYVASQGDFVYFSPTSATITKSSELEASEETPDVYAVVHRSGNLSGTTHVTISASSDGDIANWFFSNTASSSIADVTFGPGESEKTIGLYVWTYDLDANVGHVYLTITNVDGVDSIGSNNMFTLTVNRQSVSQGVQFTHTDFHMSNHEFDDGSGMDVNTLEDGSYEIDIPLIRSDSSGSLSPHISIEETNVPSLYLWIEQQPVFDDGQDTATLVVVYKYGGDIDGAPYGQFSIDPSSSYITGLNNPFSLDLYMEY